MNAQEIMNSSPEPYRAILSALTKDELVDIILGIEENELDEALETAIVIVNGRAK